MSSALNVRFERKPSTLVTSSKHVTSSSSSSTPATTPPGGALSPHHVTHSRLPLPNIELEDGLVSQLSVTDVLNNCVVGASAAHWGVTTGSGDHVVPSPRQGRHHHNHHQGAPSSPPRLYHRCYSDTTLNPVWMAFHSADLKSCGDVSLSRLKELVSLLNPSASSSASSKRISSIVSDLHQQGVKTVKFVKFRTFVTEHLKEEEDEEEDQMDAEQLAMSCWSFCKSRFLAAPFIDELQGGVVSPQRVEPVFWLFCIFCRLAEPGFYPPSIDYEEAELLMRKMMSCLGVPWSSSDSSSYPNDDAQSVLTEDYESSKLLLVLERIQRKNPKFAVTREVTFQQLLSITAEMVGADVIRSPAFNSAIKWLCLTEFRDVLKTDWIQMKKGKHGDHWRKRWMVLRGSTITAYSSQQAINVKQRIQLNENMNVEALPAGVDKRHHHFRIVEKDAGDFRIRREEQFAVGSERELREWINLVSMAIRLRHTGMTAKYAEISERRYERHRRRDSLKEVSVKRRDVHLVRTTLDRIRQDRIELEECVAERSRRRQLQMEMLARMDAVYDRLEEIHRRDRHSQKMHSQHVTQRIYETPTEDIATICQLIASNDVKLSRDVIQQRAILESELEKLRKCRIAAMTTTTTRRAQPMTMTTSSTTTKGADVDSCYDTRTTSSSSSISSISGSGR